MPPCASFQQEISLWLPTLGSGLVLVMLVREAGCVLVVLARDAGRRSGDRALLRDIAALPGLPRGSTLAYRSGPRRLEIHVGEADWPPDRGSTVTSLEQARQRSGDRRVQ